MGTSAPDLVGSPSNNQLIMKQFVVILAFLSPLALAEADASYGIHGGALGYAGSVGIAAAPVAVAQRAITAPHCQTTYDTVTSQQCHTVSEPVCHTRTVTEEVCTPAQEPECHNVVDVIQEQQCHQEQQC